METNIKKTNRVELFNSVKNFKALAPWKWLANIDIFGIKLPQLDEELFCCVLGFGGQEYGLIIYKGIEGLKALIEMTTMGEKNNDLLFEQKGLALYLNNRDELSKADYQFIKDTKVRFRGKKQWPSFRKFRVGFVSTIPNEEELAIIKQVLDITLDFTVDLKKYMVDEEWSFLDNNICVVREINTENNYTDKIIEVYDRVANFKQTINIPVAYDELSISKLKKTANIIDTVWEIDSFYYYFAVKEDGEEYYPISLLIADAESQLVIGQHLVKPLKYAEEFQKYILTLIDRTKNIPSRIVTSNRKLYFYLVEMLSKLGIEYNLVEQLYIIPHLKEEIQSMMSSY